MSLEVEVARAGLIISRSPWWNTVAPSAAAPTRSLAQVRPLCFTASRITRRSAVDTRWRHRSRYRTTQSYLQKYPQTHFITNCNLNNVLHIFTSNVNHLTVYRHYNLLEVCDENEKQNNCKSS